MSSALNRKFIFLFAAIVAGGLLFSFFRPTTPQAAPAVRFQLLDGRVMEMAELRGKPVLVVFWATTCHSCLKEIPHFSKLYQELSPQGLEIIAVAMPYDRPDHVLAMQQTMKIPYPIAIDIQGEVVRAFGNVPVTPNTFVIDPAGFIVKHHIGLWDMPLLSGLLKSMLI
ncbi:MAG: TlpA family protein disulfide reductase [Gammaproteobacteria bacterium]|nr:TlpA family protein disulfide reductase [Gammaproteobacteria bacterium]